VDAVLQSSLHTRMLRSVVWIAPRDGVYTVRVYREMAADFVKYSSRPLVVAHRMLRPVMFVQAACFPITRGIPPAYFEAFDGRRIYPSEMRQRGGH
jgi:hypothetical protein